MIQAISQAASFLRTGQIALRAVQLFGQFTLKTTTSWLEQPEEGKKAALLGRLQMARPILQLFTRRPEREHFQPVDPEKTCECGKKKSLCCDWCKHSP